MFNSVDIANLSNFCLPWGATIESWSVDQKPPESVFFTFVVTDAAYQKFHGSALTFYEPYDVSQLDRDRCYRLNVDPELVRMETHEDAEGRQYTKAVVLHDAEADLIPPEELKAIEQRQGVFAASRIGDRVLGVTKTLCLVSRSNFGDGLKRLLEYLHSRCFGPNAHSIPLERSGRALTQTQVQNAHPIIITHCLFSLFLHLDFSHLFSVKSPSPTIARPMLLSL